MTNSDPRFSAGSGHATCKYCGTTATPNDEPNCSTLEQAYAQTPTRPYGCPWFDRDSRKMYPKGRAEMSNLKDPERALVERCRADGFDTTAGCNLVDLVRRAGLTLSFNAAQGAVERHPSPEAMKAAVELEIHAALGHVKTFVIGGMIQKAIDAALAARCSAETDHLLASKVNADRLHRSIAEASITPAVPQTAGMSREQLARIFAYIWDGDANEWRAFTDKADAFLTCPLMQGAAK